MATVDSWSALVKAVQKKVNDAMKHEVLETVKDKYKEHIQTDVYDTYSPTVYNRRGNNSGLIADENIAGEMKGNTLEVKDIAFPNESISQPQTLYDPSDPTQFAKWIEYGQTYNGKAKYLFNRDMSGEVWANPRPFTENTIDELKSNPSIIKDALKKGLKERGIKTE